MSGEPIKEADLTSVPDNLPEPGDDGASNHLRGLRMPSARLRSTDGRFIDLSKEKGIVVAYFYPMTGRPGVALPAGWDQIPGARGTLGSPVTLSCRAAYTDGRLNAVQACTDQSCSNKNPRCARRHSL